MILRDGEEIRLIDPYRHKFADAMSEYLWLLSMDSGWDDQSGDVECSTGWFARFGKRLLFSDSQGFVGHDRFADEAACIAQYDLLATEYADWDRDPDNPFEEDG